MGIGAAGAATAAGVAAGTASSVGAAAATAGAAAAATAGAAGAATAGISASTLAAGSLAAGALGAGVSAYGAISNSQATAANASYQAQVAKNNQIAANQNAAYATAAGNAKAEQTSEAAAQRLGKVATGLAANGVDINSGSAAQDQETPRETGTLDTLTEVNNAALGAYGYRVSGQNFGSQAGLDTAEASQAPEAGALASGGGLLSSISSLGDKYAQFQKQAGNSGSGTTSS